ncbi:hypothetical protein FS837_007055 [Tulasnella sp. UAMH 9824]|nr:hypothetical protein FS837_007055 [Tulasnella sp. UAMH 9824]
MTAAPPNTRTSTLAELVSSETGLDVDRLTACCASVPGLPPVVTTLRQIYSSTERVSWNKGRCRKLSLKAKSLVFIICDHYDNERADTHELQNAVGKTVQNMRDIAADVSAWAELSLFKSWYSRRDIDARIKQHEESLEKVTEFLSLAATLQAHDKVAALQESLKTPASSADRRKAEDQLYKLRSAPPGEAAESTPPELACECVRLGNQPEYSGSRNDIWKGRWLDKQDVALIFYKEYKVGMRDDDSIRASLMLHGASLYSRGKSEFGESCIILMSFDFTDGASSKEKPTLSLPGFRTGTSCDT